MPSPMLEAASKSRLTRISAGFPICASMRLRKVLSSLNTAALAGRRLHFGMNERRTTGGSMALSLGTVDRKSGAWALARSQRLHTWKGRIGNESSEEREGQYETNRIVA